MFITGIHGDLKETLFKCLCFMSNNFDLNSAKTGTEPYFMGFGLIYFFLVSGEET